MKDLIQGKQIALISIGYFREKPYLNSNSFKYFRGIANDIQYRSDEFVNKSYWERWPNCQESLQYLRELGFKTRKDIDLIYLLINKLPEWEKNMVKVYLPNQSLNNWKQLCSYAKKRVEWINKFNIDYENGFYDREGYDESDDYR